MNDAAAHTHGRPTLAIGELADRSGVPQATLRTWEMRYGFPEPVRLPGGHRRYTEEDVAAVGRVLRHRTSGLSLERAVEREKMAAARVEPSVFAGLRARSPQLPARTLRKPTLLALTRAIEDECCARAVAPVLFASFQRAGFYEKSRARWSELARTAAEVVVFADFTRHGPIDQPPVRIRTAAEAPLRREWFLICDSADHPACVTGWEPPGQSGPDALRRFEVVWTVDPTAVRHAARIAAGLVQSFGTERHQPLVHRLDDRLADEPPRPSADLVFAQALFDRVVAYVDGSADAHG